MINFSFELPAWLERYIEDNKRDFSTDQQQMQFVVELSQLNVEKKTGGPFAAAVFNEQGGLISVGVNLVMAQHCSVLHAEMVALMLAQQKLKRYDLGSDPAHNYQLVSSTEPCAMCFGAVLWAGVNRLVCGARKEDAEAIGFDEGPKVENWTQELQQREITVTLDVLRDKAAAVLRNYHKQGNVIYNAGGDR
jgi:tRNA(Arg) A34 adenosine deaminase TadA